MHWFGSQRVRYSKFISPMRCQCVVRHELARDIQSQVFVKTTLDVEGRKLCVLLHGVICQLCLLAGEICLFGIGLRTDRDVLARRHRHGSSNEARDARNKNGLGARPCGSYAQDKARCGNNSVIGA